ncbi:CPBP family intramembrane glutamic endopeptidase [Nocardioides campestrisoli]|uniref:CPBP family intramembrane glutamic endopeptidase n=1 Tax=Nocardioides campestrisoli TaxID=2736757 RepID=UPI0015E6340F|nr:CPBP family intramembrane glutamic endopeptidase [Nocardioides campestrisoli]
MREDGRGEPGRDQAVREEERALEYHRLHRAGPRGLWRPLLGVLVAVLGSFLVAPLVWQLLFVVGFVAAGEPVLASLEAMGDTRDPSPLTLAYLNVVLASAIALVWAVSRGLHRLPLRWVTSVGPRMRWGYFAVCFGLSFLALFATLVVSSLVPQEAVQAVPVEVNAFTTTTRDFLLVVLLLTPWQAAGEEYLFRGYLTQAIGGMVGGVVLARVLAVLVPALLFGLAHGAQDLPVFVDRFAFGVVAGVLVIVTGGLEAALAMHVLNNFIAFGLALAFSDLGDALNPTGGTWWSLPATLTRSLVYLGLAWFVARQMGVARTVERAVLAGPEGHVYRSHSVP